MKKTFRIGAFVFAVHYPDKMILPKHFLFFEAEEETPSYYYDIIITDHFPQPEGILVAKREDLLVFQSEDRESRYLGIKNVPGFYGCYKEIDLSHADIYFSSGMVMEHMADTIFVSLFALERRMVRNHSCVLHCAYLNYQETAILFSAPSGTGKTTQANLWEQYRDSKTINGDRALLRQKDGKWYACGWPVCGTSNVCVNKEMPIRSIVMLSQEKDNFVKKLTPSRAFSLLYPQITVNGWNQNIREKTMEMVEDILGHVPIVHLGCTIGEAAVECLEESLKNIAIY